MGLEWETLEKGGSAGAPYYYRVSVPNGWLVKAHSYGVVSITFVPDEEHTWAI